MTASVYLLFTCCFVAWQKGISLKICILCVCVKVNKHSFEPFCVLILSHNTTTKMLPLAAYCVPSHPLHIMYPGLQFSDSLFVPSGKPICAPPWLKFAQVCLWNRSDICLTDDSPFEEDYQTIPIFTPLSSTWSKSVQHFLWHSDLIPPELMSHDLAQHDLIPPDLAQHDCPTWPQCNWPCPAWPCPTCLHPNTGHRKTVGLKKKKKGEEKRTT